MKPTGTIGQLPYPVVDLAQLHEQPVEIALPCPLLALPIVAEADRSPDNALATIGVLEERCERLRGLRCSPIPEKGLRLCNACLRLRYGLPPALRWEVAVVDGASAHDARASAIATTLSGFASGKQNAAQSAMRAFRLSKRSPRRYAATVASPMTWASAISQTSCG